MQNAPVKTPASQENVPDPQSPVQLALEGMQEEQKKADVPKPTGADMMTDALWSEAAALAKNLPVAVLNKPDRNDILPLSMAVLKNDMNILRVLLARGVDPEAREKSGKTAMSYALETDNAEARAILIEGVRLYPRRLAELRADADAQALVTGAESSFNAAASARARLRARARCRPKIRVVP